MYPVERLAKLMYDVQNFSKERKEIPKSSRNDEISIAVKV